jgi:hypothetical protein
MRLLLDSHALLWFWDGNAALSVAAREAIEEPTNEKHVGHVTSSTFLAFMLHFYHGVSKTSRFWHCQIYFGLFNF